jgi:hypothetical protein
MNIYIYIYIYIWNVDGGENKMNGMEQNINVSPNRAIRSFIDNPIVGQACRCRCTVMVW